MISKQLKAAIPGVVALMLLSSPAAASLITLACGNQPKSPPAMYIAIDLDQRLVNVWELPQQSKDAPQVHVNVTPVDLIWKTRSPDGGFDYTLNRTTGQLLRQTQNRGGNNGAGQLFNCVKSSGAP